MNQTERSQKSQEKSQAPLLDRDHGYFASASLTCSPQVVYQSCQNIHHVEKVLKDLPADLDNFLSLELVSAQEEGSNQFRIVWQNRKDQKIAGKLTFLIQEAPANRGTLITSEADFKKLNFKEDSPSTLMNLFLKRMKALIETGEIPTIKGQPSGREELKNYTRSIYESFMLGGKT